jgi:linoleoyl-CoA desaturase
MHKVKFINKSQQVFFTSLRAKVDGYFSQEKVSKNGDNSLILKALIMCTLYFVPYFIMLVVQPNAWYSVGLLLLMGLGMAGIGMGVMHDAVHGTFSDKKWLNTLAGSTLYFCGGNVYNWEVQHNTLHHTYTNILHYDEDITGKFLLRLNEGEKRKTHHRFQHIYAFFLYSLMTVSFLWKDFKEIGVFNKLSKSGIVKAFDWKELTVLYVSKIVYVVFIFVIPMMVLDISAWQWFAGFLIMHSISGIILSTVFQLAHVVEGADQGQGDAEGNMENAWAVHQLKTTANFNGKSKLLSWYIGGLDFQIEHHLFPKISHIHYKKISEFVAETAREFNLEYNDKKGFFNALNSHVLMLRKLGTLDAI